MTHVATPTPSVPSTHARVRPAPGSAAPARPYAVLAEFDSVDAVMHAAHAVREAGYREWDVHTPFPVHGIDHAMGTRPTILPWLSLAGGLTGLSLGAFLTWFTNAQTDFTGVLPVALEGYEYLISGKPIYSFPANIPVMFELTILLTAFATVFGMLWLNRLPKLYNPLFKAARFRRVTTDRFFVVIDGDDPKFDELGTVAFLRSLGAVAVEQVDDNDPDEGH